MASILLPSHWKLDSLKAQTSKERLLKCLFIVLYYCYCFKFHIFNSILPSNMYHTSSTILEWAFSELTRNPRNMEKVVQAEVRHVLNKREKVEQSDIHELKYLNLVIKETLRLHPPVPLLVPRESRERCEIDGYEILKGAKVFVNAWAIGRDPEYWNDANEFIPERFGDLSIDYKGNDFEYIAFGASKRLCPGMSFGVANIELPLAQLLYSFDWKLPNEVIKAEELEMTELLGATVGRKFVQMLMMLTNCTRKSILQLYKNKDCSSLFS